MDLVWNGVKLKERRSIFQILAERQRKSANISISQFPARTFFFFSPCAFCSQLMLELQLPLFTFELDCWNHANIVSKQNIEINRADFCNIVIVCFCFILLFLHICIVHPPVSTEICNDPIFCPKCRHTHLLRHLKQRFTKWAVRAIS